jgi:hydrogenase expression/formation protein HypC
MCLAVPGRVVEIREQDNTRMGKVDFGGVIKDVCLAYLPDLQVGEYTIVHVGFALQRLDEESALQSLEQYRQMGALEEEFGDAWGIAARQAGEHRPAGTEIPPTKETTR